LLLATRAEAKVMETILSNAPQHEQALLEHPGVKTTRIAKNHGQLLAVFDALSHVVTLTDEQKEAVQQEVQAMAVERQESIGSDHKIVQIFWERFDYLDTWNAASPSLNHSRNPREIAVNLNHFEQTAATARLDTPPLADLKKYLRTSRSRKFMDIKAVNSAIWLHDSTDESRGRTVKCWVFQRGPNEQPETPATRRRGSGE
jgi:hypothetical protein